VAITVMPPSAYDFSIRESLQKNRKASLTAAVIMILLAGGIAVDYFWPTTTRVDPTKSFYSDDDGTTYFTDSVFRFPPFDHNGKTAFAAMIAESGGHHFVGYLMRYTPEARKQLQQKYDDAMSNGLPVQQAVGGLMTELAGEMEVKLPGNDQPWISRAQVGRLNVRSQDGKLPDRFIEGP
jgi:hypothetical protein